MCDPIVKQGYLHMAVSSYRGCGLFNRRYVLLRKSGSLSISYGKWWATPVDTRNIAVCTVG